MRKILFLAVAIFSVGFLTSCGETKGNATGNTTGNTTTTTSEIVGTVTHVGVTEFKNLLSQNAGELIDVRTPKENQAGEISGTQHNIDVKNKLFKEEMTKLDKEKTYLVYCRSGARSGHAVKIMESMGFKHIYNLKGGYLAWKKAGN